MTLAAVRALLSDSIEFFVDLDRYLEGRSEGMIRGAQGKSRFVSLWEGKIAQENGQHELSKLLDIFEKLPTDDKFDTLSRAKQIQLEHQYKTVVAKTANYLERAKELLEEFKFNSIRSLQFIPVPAHKRLGEDLDRTLARCLHVLTTHRDLIERTVPKANKSWLSQELHYHGAMVAARASSIGLTNSTSPYHGVKVSQEDAAQNYRDALSYFKEISDKIEKVPTKKMPVTKTTRKILEIKRPEEIPASHSLHWNFCPIAIGPNMQKLKSLIDTQKDKLTVKEVEQALEMEFPQPTAPFKPWTPRA